MKHETIVEGERRHHPLRIISQNSVTLFKRLLTEKTLNPLKKISQKPVIPFKKLLTDLNLNKLEIDCEALSFKKTKNKSRQNQPSKYCKINLGLKH